MSYIAQKDISSLDFIEADRRNGDTRVGFWEKRAYRIPLSKIPKSSSALEVGVGPLARFFPFFRELFPSAEACEPNGNYALSFIESVGSDIPIYVCTIDRINPLKNWFVLVAPYTLFCMFPKEHQEGFAVSLLDRSKNTVIFDTILTRKEEGEEGRQRKKGFRKKKISIEYFKRPMSWFTNIGEMNGFSVKFHHYVFSWYRLFGIPYFPRSIHTLVVMTRK
jgi:hypothetical protein